MITMKSITIFCGSSSGTDALFRRTATETGHVLAERSITIVYGGTKIGLMGAVADGALSRGGRVIGVLPEFLKAKEIAHGGLTELITSGTMHERKVKMHELSDGAIALPGGFGTMDELFEMLTWGQLGLHEKPIALLNVGGFYDPLIEQLARMTEHGFMKEESRTMLLVGDTIDSVLTQMESYSPPVVCKWITQEKI
jgi:uncharacterized protein (TIGR00730 family)